LRRYLVVALLAQMLDHAVVARLREILAEQPVTEAELRTVTEQADGLARILRAQLQASERRLATLADDPDSSLSEAAEELRRVESLRPSLTEVRSLVDELENRARTLRTEWLLHQAESRSGKA
jgi:hypothetical protein